MAGDIVAGGVRGPDSIGSTRNPRVPATKRPDGLRVRLSRFEETADGVLRRPLWLPVVLDDFTFDEEAAHTEYQTIAAGQFSQPAGGPSDKGARQLRSSDVRTLTLDWDAPWLIDDRRDPVEVRRELYKILRSRTPFRLVASLRLPREVTRRDPRPAEPAELRMKATLRRISRSLRPGEADTRYYDLEFREWRAVGIERRSSATMGRGRQKLPTKYRLRRQDTVEGDPTGGAGPGRGTSFADLSMRFYGTYEFAQHIMEANGVKRWGKNDPILKMKRFKVGDFVRIPKKPDRGPGRGS